jgi:hypothetical protein
MLLIDGAEHAMNSLVNLVINKGNFVGYLMVSLSA